MKSIVAARCLFVYELLPFSRPCPSPCSSKCAILCFFLHYVATILMPIPSTRPNKIRSLLCYIVVLMHCHLHEANVRHGELTEWVECNSEFITQFIQIHCESHRAESVDGGAQHCAAREKTTRRKFQLQFFFSLLFLILLSSKIMSIILCFYLFVFSRGLIQRW